MASPPFPRILLVDDEEDALFLLEHAVRREFPAALILKARDASEALTGLERQAVDAVITDNRMPVMNGIEMVRLIRARDVSTPILMLTGSDHLRTTALAAGATAFLASGSWDEIRRQIRELIKDPAGG